jgi:hypothetical protein
MYTINVGVNLGLYYFTWVCDELSVQFFEMQVQIVRPFAKNCFGSIGWDRADIGTHDFCVPVYGDRIALPVISLFLL